MRDYIRKINYYETDKMGITHHSNYIRLMEEARVDFLEQAGYGYDRWEREGISSPVIGVEGEYKRPTTFDDVIRIHTEVAEYRRVRLAICYTMYNDRTGELVFAGKSQHCFLNSAGRPMALEKNYPELDQLLKRLAESSKTETAPQE